MPIGKYDRPDLTGLRFGKLVVISYEGTNDKHHRTFKIKCDCGNEKIVLYTNLVRGLTKSCGCRHKKGSENSRWTGVGPISGSKWALIKKCAGDRNIPFNITIEEAFEIWENQKGKCAISGFNLTFGDHSRDFSGTASLDRIDSNKGYTKENIQWIHKDINVMKMNLKNQELINLCIIIAEYQNKLNP